MIPIGVERMYFEYQEVYLITPINAAELLRVSNVTLNKFMKQGLVAIDTTSHHKIPKHAVVLWQDPVYAIPIQMLVQGKKHQNRTTEERLKEVFKEITELQKEYKAKTVSNAMGKYKLDDIDTLDDLSNFYKWSNLEKEKKI